MAAHGMPVGIIIREGTRADIRQVYSLVEGLSPKLVIADRHTAPKLSAISSKRMIFRQLFQRSDEIINHKNSMIKITYGAPFH